MELEIKTGGYGMAGRVWIGILLIVFGIGFLLNQMEVVNLSDVLSTWWPLFLILIGFIQMSNRTRSSLVTGLLFILIGGLLLANQWVEVNLGIFILPAILIIVGVVFLFPKTHYEKRADTKDTIDSLVLFSGNELQSQSQNFRGGSVIAVFGGSEIDLRDVVISEEGATIDLTTVFGGAEIAVPDNVQVEISGIPIFGGWGNKTRRHSGATEELPVLKLKCVVIFGGVEVRN